MQAGGLNTVRCALHPLLYPHLEIISDRANLVALQHLQLRLARPHLVHRKFSKKLTTFPPRSPLGPSEPISRRIRLQRLPRPRSLPLRRAPGRYLGHRAPWSSVPPPPLPLLSLPPLTPTPKAYINAESTAGGFPGWVTTIEGHLRSNATDYEEAWTPYIQEVCKIVKPYQITEGGPVILMQVENELAQTNTTAPYFAKLEEVILAAGIVSRLWHIGGGGDADWAWRQVVPLTFNDAAQDYSFNKKPTPDICAFLKLLALERSPLTLAPRQTASTRTPSPLTAPFPRSGLPSTTATTNTTSARVPRSPS